MTIEKNGDFNSYKIKSKLNDFLSYIKNFDFSIISYYLPKDLIKIHSTSINHWHLFGELPLRGDDPIVPIKPEEYEEVYINELIKLYNDLTNQKYTLETLTKQFQNHLNSQRKAFFVAEGLKRFSRDKIPEAFDTLLEELLVSIEVILFNYFENNMEKFSKIIQYVSSTSVTNNPLSHRLKPSDLAGCCHHLVNNHRFKWVDDENI
ncbi:hypothetical protein KPC_3826 [Acinetobacter stercoris]|uniref:ABC-three component systems C-terminal domain-containing protein n=2 Tax=Acinetobacter stercoris TaxID=2126983 RepID=A0A2U3N4P1_9GAMM|nr:hypothetical protein KPC_3826 [Acinetobacter stercoris]